MSKRATAEAQCFRNYNWPASVAVDIETLAAYDDLDADVYNQMARAGSLEEIYRLSFEFTDDPGPATRVRAALGLPKRPT